MTKEEFKKSIRKLISFLMINPDSDLATDKMLEIEHIVDEYSKEQETLLLQYKKEIGILNDMILTIESDTK